MKCTAGFTGGIPPTLPSLTSAVSPRQLSQAARAGRGPGRLPPTTMAVPHVVYRRYVERYEKGLDPAKFSKLVHFVLNFRVRVRFVDFAGKWRLALRRISLRLCSTQCSCRLSYACVATGIGLLKSKASRVEACVQILLAEWTARPSLRTVAMVNMFSSN